MKHDAETMDSPKIFDSLYMLEISNITLESLIVDWVRENSRAHEILSSVLDTPSSRSTFTL